MDPLLYVSLLLVVAALALVLVVRAYNEKVSKLKQRLREIESAKQSLSTTYGRITEQWAPFMAGYPHDARNFRFLGSPVDGVQFNDDGIVFVEIKTNRSDLTPDQKRYRALVEAGKVSWLEFRIAEGTAVASVGPQASAQQTIEAWSPPKEQPPW